MYFTQIYKRNVYWRADKIRELFSVMSIGEIVSQIKGTTRDSVVYAQITLGMCCDAKPPAHSTNLLFFHKPNGVFPVNGIASNTNNLLLCTTCVTH